VIGTAEGFVAALQRRETETAVESAKAMIEKRTPLGEQWRSIVRFAAEAGEWTVAIAAADQYLSAKPNDPARILLKAEILARGGRVDTAAELARSLASDHPSVQHFLGTLSAELGEVEQASDHLRRALHMMPGSGVTWLTLVNLRRLDPAHPDFQAVLAAAPKMHDAPPRERAPFLFALGKARDDVGDHHSAFQAFSDGASLARLDRSYDPAAERRTAQSLVSDFDDGWLQSCPHDSTSRPRPIFVNGLPRSGTTLVEQILVAHSDVADGGEVNLLSRLAGRVGGADRGSLQRFAERSGGAGSASMTLRAKYDHLAKERFGAGGRIIDKSLNFAWLAGIARVSLPAAPIVWLRRDPIETAWSCFRTWFATGVPWSFDLRDAGLRFGMEDALFEHWRAVLGDSILVVPYSDLVQEPDRWIKRLQSHCGLSHEADAAKFYKNRRAVRTASVAQVRQPIHCHALGVPGTYADRLGPFRQAYAEERERWGLPAQPT
jgi:tetratricopeptide (TPR) repeat protein